MRAVVTGGAGFIGSHLCRELLARGDHVTAIDNLLTGNLANIEELFGEPNFEFMHHDVSTYVQVPGEVDAVLHFASPASPADFERIPIQILKVGSLGTHSWARGLRLSLSVNNLFDGHQRVRDANGNTPLSFQPDYLDPVGREIRFTVRKLFF